MPANDDDFEEEDFEPVVPDQWMCQDCGFIFQKKWPPAGAEVKPCKCPRCKSYSGAPLGR